MKKVIIGVALTILIVVIFWMLGRFLGGNVRF